MANLSLLPVSDRDVPAAGLSYTAPLQPAFERSQVSNETLMERNGQLLMLLTQQQREIEALQVFVTAVSQAIAATRMPFFAAARQIGAQRQLAALTARQRQVLSMVVVGAPSKRIASVLGISQRTVENHRAAIMLKTGAGSIGGLAQLTLIAGSGHDGCPPDLTSSISERSCGNAPQ